LNASRANGALYKFQNNDQTHGETVDTSDIGDFKFH
jgi:hypothetical protein